METRKTQNRIMATITELAEYIREHAPVKFGKLCVEKHVAPSTLYGYVKILLDTHEDIEYNHGVFRVKSPAVQRK